MYIGYARVSTLDQSLNLQTDALKAAGCEKIYEEKASGAKTNREQLTLLLDTLRAGDTLVVWKLDRMGRSLSHLIAICNDLKDKGVTFISLTESINTGTNSGQLIFNVFACLAEFERSLIKERTMAGLEAARSRGLVGGRAKLLNQPQVLLLRKMSEDQTISLKTILESFGISKSTYYKYLKP
jgi:DNA invertase Pin-like site-specific DNA recombinase